MQLSLLNEDVIDEGIGKTLGALGLGATILGAGALGLHKQSSHSQPQASSTSQKQSDKIPFKFDGPRKCSGELDIGDTGSGKLRFLVGKMDKDIGDLSSKFIKYAIFKAAEVNHGTIKGLQKEISRDGKWIVVDFTWDSVE